MNAVRRLGVHPRLAAFNGAGEAAGDTARRAAAAGQTACPATATQLSHHETVQLSHQHGPMGTRLTKVFGQHTEFTWLLPVIRRSFCWHAGCWLGGVGTHLDNRASRDRLCRRGNLGARADMSCSPPQGRGNNEEREYEENFTSILRHPRPERRRRMGASLGYGHRDRRQWRHLDFDGFGQWRQRHQQEFGQ